MKRAPSEVELRKKMRQKERARERERGINVLVKRKQRFNATNQHRLSGENVVRESGCQVENAPSNCCTKKKHT